MGKAIAISAQNLGKYIQGKRNTIIKAVDGINLKIMEGEVFGFLGPNGAGKTTTIRLLAGLLKPSFGHSEIFQQDSWKNSVKTHEKIGFLTENHGNYEELTIRENLLFFGAIYHLPDLEKRLHQVVR